MNDVRYELAGSRKSPNRFWPRLTREVAWFVGIGVAGTALFLLFYNLLRAQLAPQAANVLAVGLSMIFSFVLNRRYTFARRGRVRWLGQLLEFCLVFVLTLGAGSLALTLLFTTVPEASVATENVALLLSTGVSFVARFMLLRIWVFRTGR